MAIKAVSDKDFENEVIKSEKPVIVDFWAEWCGPCKMLAPTMEELSNEHGEVKFCKVNVDENPLSAMEYKIAAIPMVIGFKDGKPVAKTVGVQPKTALEDMIKGIL